ncbi:hypothetical protein EYR38_003437 [Pleurotus pulmonarius]|nr:hypothetical protein EYR38_003437 [Pleurotus pulmonarius]
MAPGGTLFLESSSLIVREYTYLASLTVLVYEYFTTLYLEVDFIWKPPITFIKCLFFASRYLALVSQIISQALFFSLDRTGRDPYTYRQCIAWHSFQTASFQTLLFVVECIQTMKIQALYAGNRKMLWTLHTFRAVALCLMTYTTVATLILLSYDGACIVSSVPWHVVWFGATAIITQAIISIAGLSPTAIRDLRRQSTLFAIITRDSFFTFLLVTTLSAVIITHASLLAPIIPSLFITTLSISGCRMIINMLETENRSGRTLQTGSVHLTSLLNALGSMTSGGPVE